MTRGAPPPRSSLSLCLLATLPPPPPPRFALKQDKLPEDGAYGDKFAKMSEKTPKKRRGRGVAAGGGDDATDGASTFGGVSTLGASDATGGTGLSLSSIDGLPNSLDMLPGTVVSMRAGLLYQDPDGLERPMSTTGRFVDRPPPSAPAPARSDEEKMSQSFRKQKSLSAVSALTGAGQPEFESPDAEFDDAASRASAGTRFSRASRDSGDSRPGTAKSAWSGGPGSPSKPGSPAGSPGKRRSRLSFADEHRIDVLEIH